MNWVTGASARLRQASDLAAILSAAYEVFEDLLSVDPPAREQRRRHVRRVHVRRGVGC